MEACSTIISGRLFYYDQWKQFVLLCSVEACSTMIVEACSIVISGSLVYDDQWKLGLR